VRRAVRDIHVALRQLSRGEGNATAARNVRAAVLRLAGEPGSGSEVRGAASALIAALDALEQAQPEKAAALAAGTYPPALEVACGALDRFGRLWPDMRSLGLQLLGKLLVFVGGLLFLLELNGALVPALIGACVAGIGVWLYWRASPPGS